MQKVRNILLKAFFINFAVLTVIAIIGFCGGFDALLARFMKGATTAENTLMLRSSVAIYKIGNILLFLVPALAIQRELCCEKKRK
ncbi:hypothetical protein AGMMS50249_1670 [candidate division SR1 bacterium]|nr:hypothetical protein AGMMS50249_1670 [candidate division SR1 bacterium]